MTDAEAQALAEAIKNMEPSLRVSGRAPAWNRFHSQFHSGQFSEEKTLQEAIDNSAGDKVDLKNND